MDTKGSDIQEVWSHRRAAAAQRTFKLLIETSQNITEHHRLCPCWLLSMERWKKVSCPDESPSPSCGLPGLLFTWRRDAAGWKKVMFWMMFCWDTLSPAFMWMLLWHPNIPADVHGSFIPWWIKLKIRGTRPRVQDADSTFQKPPGFKGSVVNVLEPETTGHLQRSVVHQFLL